MRAVFLDRDGVLNRAIVREGRPYAPLTLDDFAIVPGAAEALARLKGAGYLLIVATNQPEVARGTLAPAILDEMHRRLRDALPLDDIRVCAEEDGPHCTCYKPKPGLLLDAAREHAIALGESWMVGDRWRDVGCGRNAGCRTVFIDCGYAERRPDAPDVTVRSLSEAVDAILG